MHNYDDALNQIHLAGLLPKGGLLEVDGKVHRCKVQDSHEKRGWYLLHEWRAGDGTDYVVGTFGVWQGNEANTQKIEIRREQPLSSDERMALKARLAEDRKRAKAQRDAQAERAARRAAKVWAKALREPVQGQPVDYLARKGVSGYGVRYTESGAVVIPMMDARGDTKGLQFILPKGHPKVAKTGRDKEYWPAGLAKQGRWFQIGGIFSGAVVLVTEGYATGATLHAATGLPVVVAFDANNLLPVAQAVKKAHRVDRFIVCADDDYLQKCKHCHQPTLVADPVCKHCGQEHGQENPGCKAAAATALAVGGHWVAPVFPADRGGKKLTDFNDLQQFPQGGLALVRSQIEAKVAEAGWSLPAGASRSLSIQGGGESGAMVSRLSIDDAVLRYVGTYGMGGKVLFDTAERRLVHKDDVLNLLPSHGWDSLKNHPAWRVVRDHEIGFDPTCADAAVKCNLFGGWPNFYPSAEPVWDPETQRIVRYDKAGDCSTLLELLQYLCSNEQNADEVYQWMLNWLAYPLQHPGAKMHSAIVVHGPQGTGKSRFFEAYSKIFGPYGRVLGQEALEDKFNADWAEKKLFILADEVLAKSEMYHIKNRLKGFITGDTIRVNPKNIAAHNERNQMNLVFLSNERQPLVLENDDRRHCVIWVPPKLDENFFAAVNDEIDNGGVAALHDHLLRRDLREFRPWTKPPMTGAKRDLIQQSLSSEDRFLAEWMALEVEGANGEPLPFCPCSGVHLYQAYERWCSSIGERPRRMQELVGLAGKRQGWRAGVSCPTWASLVDPTIKNRKLVVPCEVDMQVALKRCRSVDKVQEKLMPERFETKAKWLTAGFFKFSAALGVDA